MLQQRLIPNGMHVASTSKAMQGLRPAASARLLRTALRWWKLQDVGGRSLRSLLVPQILQQAACDLKVLAWRPGILAIAKAPDRSSERILEQLRDCVQSVDPDLAHFTSVSRLDFPTSGVLIVAHGGPNSVAANFLQAQFASRLVKKQYLCLVQGETLGPAGSRGEISQPLLITSVTSRNGPSARVEPNNLGQDALTRYEVLEHFVNDQQDVMYMRVMPVTGRMHQIRAHFACIGRPLVP
jgi:23S rRNA-/tRNA-specific pseudouridylate synthase